MKKVDVHAAVALRMAELGYAQGWFGWPKPGRLEVYDGATFKRTTFAIPAGAKMTKARLAEVLATIPACGPARAYTLNAAKDDGGGR